LGATLRYANDLAGAEAVYRESLELDSSVSGNAVAGVGLAAVILEQSPTREDQAKRILEAVLRKQPDNTRAWATLGGLHGRAGRKEDAQRCFARAANSQ